MRAEWAVIGLGALLLFPLQGAIDARRGEAPDIIRTLPPDPVLPVLSFGHAETASDLLELQAINFLMDRLDRFNTLEQDHLERLYAAVLALDPNNVGAAVRGAIYMSSVAVRPREAVRFLERVEPKAHPQHPQRWRLPYERGSIHLVNLAGQAVSEAERVRMVAKAGVCWQEAAPLPGAPAALGRFGRDLAERGLSRQETIQIEVETWRQRLEADDPVTRRVARRRLRTAESGLKAEQLTAKLQQAGARGPDVQAFLSSVPDPAGVGFLWRRGVVVSPAYEAAFLERELRSRLRIWRAEDPDRPARIEADLGLSVPDYLRVIRSAEGAWVFPRSVGPFPPLRDPAEVR